MTQAQQAAEPPKIDDNPAVVEPALIKVRKYFDLGKTRPYQFRVNQLNALRKGLVELTKDFDDALKKDLGKGSFENWMCELLMVQREIDHTLMHLKEWMSDEPRDTPFMIGPG